MKSLYSLLFALCAFSSFATVLAQESPKSLIANGNFEINRDGWPDQWPKPKEGVKLVAEGENHFLRLESTKPGETVLLYHAIKLPADVRALALSFKMRTSNLKPGKQPWFDARILLEFKDKDGNKLPGGPAAPYLRNNSDWVEKKISFLVPAGATTLEFMPSLLQVETGTLDLDDVSLTPTDPAPLIEAAKAAADAAELKQFKDATSKRAKAAELLGKEGNLLSNGDFERDPKKTGWPEQWGKPKEGGSYENESDNFFLRLKSPQPGAMVMLYRTVDIPGEVEALKLTWRQRITDLKPGKEPWFDARIMLEFKDAAGRKLSAKPSPPYTRSNTSGWVEKETTFLVPKEALTLEFMPALFQVERGTFDLDSFVLKPVDAAPLLAAAKAAEEEERRSHVDPEVPQRDRWPLPLHVRGNQILNSKNESVWLQGMNVVSLEWSVRGEKVLKSTLVAVDEWQANCIRLPVKEEYWFGRVAGQKDGGAEYRALVDQVITLVANRGKYVVLDLHRFRAPTAAHVEFWKDAATKYREHPAVLFDLFNEPHGTTWEVWRDGGFVAEEKKAADEDAFLTPEEKAKKKNGFDSVGMQKLIDTVREAGAKNIVIVGGLDWAYDLSGIAKGFEVNDRGGHGIVYSTHIYPWKRDWAGKVLLITDKYPIFIGEVGADINKMTFIPAEAQEDPYTWVPDMLGLIQKHKLHWTAFSFHPKATPVMIQGWDYTPTPFWGQFVKEALAGKEFTWKKNR